MPLLTLCMPSNRNLEKSKSAIEGALAYCEQRDALIVISDNSGDASKESWWRNRSPRITYLTSLGTDAFTNFLTSVRAAETPFILQVGDDDGIGFDPSVPPFDLSALPADYMGVRPKTEVLVTGAGVVRTKEFSIDSLLPADRILEYSAKAASDNSAFYSIFRREPYLNLMTLFADHHPTGAAFTDWALSLALFAYGRMAYDPGTIYRYNADQWSDMEKIKAKNAQLFEAAGLPPHTTLFQPLFMALDLYIFVSRPGTPLNQEEMLNAISVAAGAVLNGFLNQVLRSPADYSETVQYVAGLALNETDALARFQMALVLVDQLKPGLKEKYVAFYRKAHGMN